LKRSLPDRWWRRHDDESGIAAVVPWRLGIGTFCPLLDAKGKQRAGLKVCEELSQEFALHLFNATALNDHWGEWLD
jgi:glutaminase